MITILVRLEVKDFSALEEFESQAARIMQNYQGRISSAFETIRKPDGSGEEIHILEFPNEESFANYRADKSLAALSSLRNKAISNTEVKISVSIKSYV